MRQTNHNLPTIFIGSSSMPKALNIARALKKDLSQAANVLMWTDAFDPGGNTLGSLIQIAGRCDFAVIIFTPDDPVTQSNNAALQNPLASHTPFAPRDNCVFELGLFIGVLGLERAWCCLNWKDSAKIPTDFLGITAVTFDDASAATNPQQVPNTSMASASIKNAMAKQGRFGGHILLRNQTFSSEVREIAENAQKATSLNDPQFRSAILSRLKTFAHSSQSWNSGSLVYESDYIRILADCYREAQTSIFSTSTSVFKQTWTDPTTSRMILEAQESCTKTRNVKCTRVFIFDSEETIGNEDEEIFAAHKAAGVSVLVYQEPKGSQRRLCQEFSVTEDFGMIDEGRIIAETKITHGSFQAEWHFDNRNRHRDYDDFKVSLEKMSRSV